MNLGSSVKRAVRLEPGEIQRKCRLLINRTETPNRAFEMDGHIGQLISAFFHDAAHILPRLFPKRGNRFLGEIDRDLKNASFVCPVIGWGYGGLSPESFRGSECGDYSQQRQQRPCDAICEPDLRTGRSGPASRTFRAS